MAEETRRAICDPWWRQHTTGLRPFDRFSGVHKTGVLVIGGGITGLSTALELHDRGFNVTVCEANRIGAGTTAGSSGHLDAHPEMGPRQLIDQLGREDAVTYTSLRQAAIDRIEQRSGEAADFARVDAYYYSDSAADRSSLEEDLGAAQQLGLDAAWCEDVPIERAVFGYRLRRMGRFNSAQYLHRLAEQCRERGVRIYENTMVPSPQESEPTSLQVNSGRIEFEHLVSATHSNFISGIPLYAATPPYQSYLLVAKVARAPVDALFWDNSDPYYYVRRVGAAEESLVMVGGRDHRTGMGDPLQSLRELEQWADERFGLQQIEKRWSAELFEPTDGLPMIGLAPGKKNIWVATGLSGVGLTLGTVAGHLLAEAIDGKAMPLEEPLSPSRLALSGEWASEQTKATANVSQRVLPAENVAPAALQPGEGAVGKVDDQHVAVCRDRQGCEHRFSPVCPHMGGVVHWNELEQTWDCALHGGRFSADGQRLYGPPEQGLDAPS
ncbi:FAD-dependent oxidoreductase [Roseimaritima sediminicola]|uniref:FAD-dependent oxidoreductase n=1 Tax=Roseimaritima sediminicola TaxID=2662066 RepID=UPI0012985852|nr:FAD-dependent oxidoreductase [Roseimaritima sediminicola]